MLISCYAGRLPGLPPSLFERVSRLISGRREKQYLAEILVNKAFFDQVLAPDGEITSETGIALIQDALTKAKQSLAKPVEGLSRIAERLRCVIEEVFA